MSIVSVARLKAFSKSVLLNKALAPIGLVALLCIAAPDAASAQPAGVTCRTPAVDARIAQLMQQIAAIDAQEDPIRAEVTDRALKGLPVSNPQARLQPFEQQKQPLQAELAQLERLPPCAPRVYNAPYNAPLLTPWDVVAAAFGIYNAPTEPGRGWYFGPTGSLSVLRDSDIIKRVDLGSSDTILRSSDSFRMPRSITGNSATWVSSSNSWLRSSDSLRLDREGSKTKLLTSSTGYDVGARAGYQFNNIRIEGQFDYANNGVDTFGRADRTFSTDFVMRDQFAMRDRAASGSTTSYTFLINGFVDLNVPYLSTYGATPYFGGGIGGGQTSLDLKWGNRTIVNDSEWGLAYQLGAGVRWQIMPNWSLDLGYRYKGITDVTLHNEFEKIIVPNRSHNFEVGLLWNWGAIATVPPYTPPPTQTPYLWQQGPQFGPTPTPYTPPPPPPLLPPPPPRPPA